MQTDIGQAAAIQKLVETVSKNSYPFFTSVAAVGVLTMAIIQTAKDLFPIRQKYQRCRVRRWLSEKNAVSAGEAEEDLVRMATDGDRKALYDLPVEQLCGQISAASQLLMDNPSGHENLFRAVASSAAPQDIQLLLSPPDVVREPRNELKGEDLELYDSYVDARNRMAHQIQRAIDGLQIAIGFRWKFYLQFTSIVLSAVIAGFAVWLFSGLQGAGTKLGATFAVAILGGFLAPVARDLVASLQQLRK